MGPYVSGIYSKPISGTPIFSETEGTKREGRGPNRGSGLLRVEDAASG